MGQELLSTDPKAGLVAPPPMAPPVQGGPRGPVGSVVHQADTDPLGYFREMAGKAPESAWNLVTETAQAIPAIGELLSELTPAGATRRLTSGSGEPSKLMAAVVGLPGQMAAHYLERYGTDEARATTLRDDPFGLVADMVALVSGAQAAKHGAVAGAGRVSQAANSIRTTVGKVPAAARQMVAKRALQVAGVPGPVADMMTARMGGAKPSAATSPAPVAASAPAAVAPPVPASAPVAAPPAPAASSPRPPVKDPAGATLHTPWAQRTKGQQSAQSVRNDLGIAVKRSKVELTEPEYAQAAQLVTQGKTAMEAVTEIASRQQASSLEAMVAGMNVDEAQAMLTLLKSGKTPQEAVAAIEAQRSLSATTKATPAALMRERVKARQTTGRWPAGTP